VNNKSRGSNCTQGDQLLLYPLDHKRKIPKSALKKADTGSSEEGSREQRVPGSSLVTDPYAEFGGQQQTFHETMLQQTDDSLFKDVKFPTQSSPDGMRRTIPAADKSGVFVHSTEKSADATDFRES